MTISTADVDGRIYLRGEQPGIRYVNHLGRNQLLKSNFMAVDDPTVDDDDAEGYSVGSQWINTEENKVFVCTNKSVGEAVWEELTGTAGSLPGGAGTELQYRVDDNTLGAITGSSWDGTTLTLPATTLGRLHIVGNSTDSALFYVDGTTNPYIGTDNYTAFEVNATIDTADSNEIVSVNGYLSEVIQKHSLNGSNIFVIQETTAYRATVTSDVTHSVNGSFVMDDYSGFKVDVYPVTNLTGTSIFINSTGISASVNNTVTINNASGSFAVSSVGIGVSVSCTPTILAGNVNVSITGLDVSVSGFNTGTSVSYGIRITNSSSCDTKWTLYSNQSVASWHRGQWLVGGTAAFTSTANLHVKCQDGLSVGQIIQAATSQSANLFEVNSVSGSGGDLFKIASDGKVSIQHGHRWYSNGTNGFVMGVSGGQHFSFSNSYVSFSPSALILGTSGGTGQANSVTLSQSAGALSIVSVSATAARFDGDSTAGNTRMLVFDVDSNQVQRVKVGANGSGPGGTGRALYIDDTV